MKKKWPDRRKRKDIKKINEESQNPEISTKDAR